MVLGIFAGVGSGKSLLLEMLAEYGFKLIEADKVAHKLYKTNDKLKEALKDKFGTCILDENGDIDRKALSEILFADSKLVEFINSLVHPLVWAEIKREVYSYASADINVAVEAAILPSEEDAEIYDYKIFLKTDSELRYKRLRESRAYSDDRIKNIISNQPDTNRYESYCDFILYNNSDKDDLRKNLELLLEKINDENV